MKISTILDNVDYGQLALPEFQRGYVWNRDQVRGLFSSLYLRYPVGGLLVWTTEAEASLTRGDSLRAGSTIRLLLDGQQRITSLYGVARGKQPDFFQGNAKSFKDLFFNLRHKDGEPPFEFYGPVKMRDDPFWISVTELFLSGSAEVPESVAGKISEMKAFAVYSSRLAHLLGIRDIDLHVEEITGTGLDIDEVVEIFNRVNSGGTKLSAGDLALARICADWPGARKELRGHLDRWGAGGFDLKQDWLLRAVTAAATEQAPFSALRSVSTDQFAVALGETGKAVDLMLNLIRDRLGLDHDRVLAGRYALTALARLVAVNKGTLGDQAQQQRALYWYVGSFLWGRYSGSTETVLQRDLDAIAAGGVDGLISELERWRGSLEVRPSDFDSWSLGSRSYPLLYLLSRVHGARDLLNGMTLSSAMLGAQSALHVHHIFPKARLYAAGYARPLVNALGNFCLLTGGSNMTISDGEPATYLAAVESAHPGVLASQWIPMDPELWKIERYPDFLAARRALLAAAANELLGSLLSASQPDPELPPVSHASPEYDEDPLLVEILRLSRSLGLADPEIQYEINDEDSGELQAIADLAWPDGVQKGLSSPTAFLIAPDEEMESRLGALGYRFFTEKQRLIWYFEEVLGADIDGDDLVGEAPMPSATAGLAASAQEEPAGAKPVGLEAQFHEAALDLYRRSKSEAGYNASLFLRMVSDHGGLESARRLIAGSAPSDGFTALWERGRLDLTAEALALKPEFASLFSGDELRRARDRLKEYGHSE